MNHDDMKTKLYKLISSAQRWQMFDLYGNEDDHMVYRQATKTHEADILAEFDHLKCQLKIRNTLLNAANTQLDHLIAEIEQLKGAQEGRCSIDVELERK